SAAGDQHGAPGLERYPRALPLAGRALDVKGDPDASPPRPRRAVPRVGFEQLEGGVKAALVVARVVAQPKRRAMGKLADQVAPTQFNAVAAELAGGVVDEPFEQVGRVRPPRSPVGTGRNFVGAPADDRDR